MHKVVHTGNKMNNVNKAYSTPGCCNIFDFRESALARAAREAGIPFTVTRNNVTGVWLHPRWRVEAPGTLRHASRHLRVTGPVRAAAGG